MIQSAIANRLAHSIKGNGSSRFWFIAAILLMGMPASADVLNVTVDTHSLNGTAGQLAFDFIDGGPPANTVTITGFASDGTLGTATLTNDVTGNLPGTVQLGDTSFFNEYLAGFTFGNQISFQISATNLPPAAGSAPDEFSFFLLDSTGGNSLVTTSDPSGADTVFDLGSDGSQDVFTSTQETTTVEPVNGSVPEPSSILLLAGILGLLLVPRRWRPKAICLWLAILFAGSHSGWAQGVVPSGTHPSAISGHSIIGGGANFTFTTIVDTNTPRPDGQGNFGELLFASTDGSFVVWDTVCCGAGTMALWSANLSAPTPIKLADTNTAAPNGSGNFSGFGEPQSGPQVRGGTAVFVGVDSVGPGLYSEPAGGGPIQPMVNENTAMPDNTNLQQIHSFRVDNGVATFAANPSAVLGVGTNGSGLTALGDGSHLFRDPETNGGFCVSNFAAPAVGGGQVVFFGTTVFDPSTGYNAVYTLPGGGPAGGSSTCDANTPVGPVVVDSYLALPGDPTAGTTHTRFDAIETDGKSLFFLADDTFSSPSFSGIFSVPLAGGAVTKIAAVGDVLPGIGTVTNFGNNGNLVFSVDNGAVVFGAFNAQSTPAAHGIFLAANGQIYKIAANGDVLDGVTANQNSTYGIGPGGFKNGKIAFQFEGFAILVAAPVCTPDISSQVSVSRGGFRLNHATKQFVQQVTLTNSTGAPISGPMQLVIENLSGNATLVDESGVSVCAAPGSPVVTAVASGGSLAAGASVILTLSFSDPSLGGITYTTAVIGGAGVP